jgi:carbonic anhydrase
MRGSLQTGRKLPFVTHVRRSPLQQCVRAAQDSGSSYRSTPSAETADSPSSSPSQYRPRQFVEISSAAPAKQQEAASFLGTPQGVAAALAVAGVAGLGLKALFGRGSSAPERTARQDDNTVGKDRPKENIVHRPRRTMAFTGATPSNAAELQELIDGNQRFVEGNLQNCKADNKLVKQLAAGQAPKTVVLACSDSRSPPELLFDKGLGDLFVVRVAGNLAAGPHAAGSVLFAVAQLKSRVIVVLGHTKCGAISATVDAYKAGKSSGPPDAKDPISSLVADIHPAVHSCHSHGHSGKDDATFKDEVVKENSKASARSVVKLLADKLPAETQAEVTVVAAVYNIEHGGVDILEVMPVGAPRSTIPRP